MLIGTVSCGESKKAEEKGETTEIKESTKGFSYSNESTKVSWVAYKTTDKKGVKGEFSEFEIKDTKDAETAVGVFEGASFVIQTNSVKTGNEERDNRIVKSFFNIFVNTATITGKVKSLDDKTGILEVTFNELTNEIPVKVVSEGNEFALEGVIDLNKYNGKLATDSLNVACGAEHQGPDGIVKLWPDVNIKVATTLTAK